VAGRKRVQRVLGIFAKAPEPGRVKTRLCPPLTAEGAAALYAAFVEDTVERLGAFAPARGIHIEVVLAPEGRAGVGWPSPEIPTRLQRGEGLMRRLSSYFEEAFRDGATAAAVVGSDSPTLPLDRIERAFEAIDRGADGAIVPDDGGGYCALGLARPVPALFEGIEAGTDRVLAATLARAAAAGLRLETLEGWYDVDRIGDLSRLRRELAMAPCSLAPRTREALSTLSFPEEEPSP